MSGRKRMSLAEAQKLYGTCAVVGCHMALSSFGSSDLCRMHHFKFLKIARKRMRIQEQLRESCRAHPEYNGGWACDG